jgi:hypothetical protein
MPFKKEQIIKYSIIVLFLLLVVTAIFNSLSDSGDEKVYEEVTALSPVGSNEVKDDKFLQRSSDEQFIKFRSTLSNWQDVFDIIAYNRNLFNYDTLKNTEKFEEIKARIERKKFFAPGSVTEMVDKYGELIIKHCNEYKIDWRLIISIIHQESYFNPEAISKAGAYGFMQIMPGTGLGLQKDLNLEDTKTPINNLTAGMYYYATLAGAFEFTGEEKYKFALAAYNAGLARVVDAMTITNYYKKDYTKWDNVKEYYPYLASNRDSVHKLVWPKLGRPPGGTLNNWMEPYKYVEYIMYYYENYKKIYKSNLVEEKPKKKKSKKK